MENTQEFADMHSIYKIYNAIDMAAAHKLNPTEREIFLELVKKGIETGIS